MSDDTSRKTPPVMPPGEPEPSPEAVSRPDAPPAREPDPAHESAGELPLLIDPEFEDSAPPVGAEVPGQELPPVWDPEPEPLAELPPLIDPDPEALPELELEWEPELEPEIAAEPVPPDAGGTEPPQTPPLLVDTVLELEDPASAGPPMPEPPQAAVAMPSAGPPPEPVLVVDLLEAEEPPRQAQEPPPLAYGGESGDQAASEGLLAAAVPVAPEPEEELSTPIPAATDAVQSDLEQGAPYVETATPEHDLAIPEQGAPEEGPPAATVAESGLPPGALDPGDQECRLFPEVRSHKGLGPCLWDDGSRLVLLDGHSARQVEKVQECRKFLVYVADYPEVDGLGVLNIQGSFKYAEVLARKRLEERGEMTPDSVLVVYHKQKQPGGITQLLYQVVPRDRYQELQSLPEHHAQGLVVFDTLALLRGLTLRLPSDKVQALALRLHGALLVLVARGQETFLARRYTLLGDGPEALRDALFTVHQDLEMIRGQLPEPVQTLCLAEPLLLEPEAPFRQPESLELQLKRLPLMRLEQDGGAPCWSALPPLVRQLPFKAGSFVGQELWLRPLERIEPLGIAVLFLLGLLALAYAQLLGVENGTLAADNATLEQRLAALQADTPPPMELPENSVAPFLALAELLAQAREAPSIAGVLQRLGAAKPQTVCIERVSLDYGPRGVQVDLQARSSGGLAENQLLQLQFIERLEHSGLVLQHRTLALDTESDGEFTLNLLYPAGAAQPLQPKE